MPNGWMQWVGVADGVLLAAVTALGQAVPAWSHTTQGIVEVLGLLGTILGGMAMKASNAAAAAAKKSS